MSYANVAATLALVLAMSGGAIAATGGFSSGGTLRACANEEGRLKLLKSGERCRHGQKGVSWNQTGPAGPKGLAGAPGAPGAAGPTGPAGAAGAPATPLFAVVGVEGQLIRGSGVTGVTGADPYVVKFNRDVSKCAYVATLNAGPADEVFTAEGGENGTTVGVITLASGGGLSKSGSTLVVTCP